MIVRMSEESEEWVPRLKLRVQGHQSLAAERGIAQIGKAESPTQLERRLTRTREYDSVRFDLEDAKNKSERAK